MTAKTRHDPPSRTRTLQVVIGSIMNSRSALIDSARHDASGLARSLIAVQEAAA